MDPSSDTEECQLYTRAAQNISQKRKQFTAKLEDFENLIKLDKESGDSIEEMCFESLMDIALKETKNLDEEEESNVGQKRKRNSSRGRPKKSHQNKNRKRAKQTKTNTSNKRSSTCKSGTYLTDSDPPSGATVSSVGVNDSNVIILDDDTEFANSSFPPIEFSGHNSSVNSRPTLSPSVSKDLSIISVTDDMSEDEDEPVVISIEWNNGRLVSRKQFELRKYQKFETIFGQLASIEGLPTTRISLMRDFKNINPSDTPDSLNLKYYAGLTGSISATDINYARLSMIDDAANKQDASITVKLKLESQKTFNFNIMKHQKMKVLYKKCSEELNCDESVIKLTFDGDYVDPKDLLTSFDVEDGDIFNVYIKKDFK